MTAHIKQGALLPELELTATKKDPETELVSLVDLTLAQKVEVVIWHTDKNMDTVITGPVADVDFANGVGKYTWQVGDTDYPGSYDVELRVTWPGTGLEIFPTVGVARVVIDESNVPYYPHRDFTLVGSGAFSASSTVS